MDIIILYLLIINALGFLLMLIDKQKAIHNRWRIPELVLLGVALVGGSLGAIMGMRIFRHKTKHLQFSLGLPVMLVVHIMFFIFLYTI